MILAVLGEIACCGIEIAAIERLVELFGDAPIGLCDVQGSLLHERFGALSESSSQ
ncbi:MAG TPA: hypothetical protein VEK33_12000 [Terriglobales bacterium]|nr:hypothetical protein [Terriglobales bacterium]